MRLGGEEEHTFVQVREEVWVKPPNTWCTSQCGKGTITSNSKNNVSVYGMSHHVLDVRKIVNASEDGTSSSGQDDEDSSSRQDVEASSSVPGTQASPRVAQRPQRDEKTKEFVIAPNKKQYMRQINSISGGGGGGDHGYGGSYSSGSSRSGGSGTSSGSRESSRSGSNSEISSSNSGSSKSDRKGSSSSSRGISASNSSISKGSSFLGPCDQ
eukprot:XP_014778397.1 PREDICTED: probable GH family 25 lysozyme 3 [Octopus bimaculoides]